MRTVALFTLFALAASAASDFYLCEVVIPNFCATQGASRQSSCMAEPSLTLNGRSVSLTDNYGVISFGDFRGDTSDSEHRVAVKGSGVVEAGYSIAAEVYSKGPGALDTQIPYSAIFGQNLYWPSGRLFPDGLDQFVAAYNEDMYVGGNFVGPDYLASRMTTNARSAGAFDAEFNAAQQFYVQVQNALAAVSNNIQITVEYTTATVTCPAGASAYSGTISTADLATVTSYVFVGCSADVQMVINVPSDGVNTVKIHSGAMEPSARRSERTVFNIQGSGRTIDMASVGHYGVILAPLNNYQQTGGFTQSIVIVANVNFSHQFNRLRCVRPTPPATPSPCVSFEETCAGTLFTAPGASTQGDTREYNLISFGNFVADTGDVEGRVMARNDFLVGDGYTVGFEVSTANNVPDRHQDYALIVGRNCQWGSGSLHPDGTGLPKAGAAENAFCGSSFNGADYLAPRVTGTCSGSAGCLDSVFDAAKSCYEGYSSDLASTRDNVQHSIEYSALTVTCADNSATSYYLTLTAAEMTQYTYYVTVNCNYQAYWTINIASGSDDVIFAGDSFPAVPGAVVYNVQGCRTVQVRGNSVNGHILATCGTLNQTGGVIRGKTVVGNVIMALQINKEDVCRTITEVEIPVLVIEDNCVANTNIQVGEYLKTESRNLRVSANVANCLTFENDPQVLLALPKGSKAGTVTRASDAGAGVIANENNKSSASMVTVSVALIAIVALLF